jgi:hypothetical protein
MGHLRWTPPKEGWIKLNTNVAFLVNMGEPSADIIAWNAAGERCYYLRGEPYVLAALQRKQRHAWKEFG